jgi:hypothetical protein
MIFYTFRLYESRTKNAKRTSRLDHSTNFKMLRACQALVFSQSTSPALASPASTASPVPSFHQPTGHKFKACLFLNLCDPKKSTNFCMG